MADYASSLIQALRGSSSPASSPSAAPGYELFAPQYQQAAAMPVAPRSYSGMAFNPQVLHQQNVTTPRASRTETPQQTLRNLPAVLRSLYSEGVGNDRGMGPGYATPSGQTLAEQMASAGSTYGSLAGGMLPGGMMANMASGAYIDGRLNDAARNGGYSGMYSGNAAFGNRANNTAVAGSLGPLSGDAWGGVAVDGWGGLSGLDGLDV